MTAPVDPADVELALDLAREAGAFTLDWFRSTELEVERKHDGTPVTVADRGAESIIRARLAEARPSDGVVGEEHAETPGSSGRRWIVDPIDGTTSFTHGVPLYATLVALVDDEGPQVGVIHLPALDETVWAWRGGGCWADGVRAHVNRQEGLTDAYVMTSGFSYWPPHLLPRALAPGRCTWRTWGDAYGYALVATGRCEGMVDPIVNVYDVAPMQVIIEEAGGRFTDLSGVARIDGGSGVASNGLVHDELLTLLAPDG